ncbi:MAG: copper resistance protein NlpE N-terminal domain-containing protein [Weeksellaceae bacterium]|jgi:uncharacterized lipoprotein NlpE involved in copper resistance
MKIKLLSLLFASAFIMYSCDTKKEDVIVVDEDAVILEDSTSMADEHNAQTSLDWKGTYEGVLPCADCEGIKTELELNDDNTYELETEYLGAKEELKETQKGTFIWVDGNNIQLEGLKDENASKMYKIEENKVRFLNKDGSLVEGELAEHYVLTKK